MPSSTLRSMRLSAKADYAVRLAAELAAAPAETPVTGPALAAAQEAPLAFCESILGLLRTAGIVRSRRGAEGGYLLARDAADVTVADVIRAVDGPLAAVHGDAPESVEYPGTGGPAGRRLDRRPRQPPRRPGAGHARRPRRRPASEPGGEARRHPGREEAQISTERAMSGRSTSPPRCARLPSRHTMTDHTLAAALAEEAGRLLLELRPTIADPAELKAAGDARSTSCSWSASPPSDPTTRCCPRRRRRPRPARPRRVWIVDPLDGTREYGEAPRRLGRARGARGRRRGRGRRGGAAGPGRDLSTRRPHRGARPRRRPAAARGVPDPPARLVTAVAERAWAPSWSRWARPGPRPWRSSRTRRRLRRTPAASTSGTRPHRSRWRPPPGCTSAGSTARRSSTTTPTRRFPTCWCAARSSRTASSGRARGRLA